MSDKAESAKDALPAADLPWADRDARGRHAMLMEILAQVSGEALQGETPEQVLQRIVDAITRRLPVAIASIILLDDAGTHFVQEVWSGQIQLGLPTELPWPVTIGAAGRCARSGEAQLITDTLGDPDYVPGNRDVRAEYIVPIRHRQRLHGVLNLESTREDFFSAEVRAAFDAIAAQIAGAIHLARMADELELANRRLQRLSMSDGLTGIANRRHFDEQLADEWRQHVLHPRSLALLLIDIDYFKPLNDALGHLHGDECLREMAILCSQAAHGEGLVARYGGDEFAMLLPGRTLEEAQATGSALCMRVFARALAHPRSPVAPCVTVSIGVAAIQPERTQSPETLIAIADRALYEAKAQGRNGIVAR